MIWRNRPTEVCSRIADTLPDVKLLALLRNPADRALSAFSHHMRRGRIPADQDLVDWVTARDPDEDRFCIVSGGWYAPGPISPVVLQSPTSGRSALN